MMRRMLCVLALIAAGAALAPASQAQGAFGCACVNNRVGQPIHFQYRQGNGPWTNRTLLPGHVYSFCHPYGAGPHTSPQLHFMLDRDPGPGSAWTDYTIQRVQTNTTQCAQIPAIGQYYVSFQPGSNNQLLVVGRVATPAAAPPPHGPGPGPAPGTGQAAFGCACVNNGVGAPIQFQHRWGTQPFTTHTLLPGRVYAFCWPYGAGLHTSPPLQFMLNRAVGGPVAFTNYALARVQSPTNQCSGVPSAGQYFVRFQPGTNNQFLHVSR